MICKLPDDIAAEHAQIEREVEQRIVKHMRRRAKEAVKTCPEIAHGLELIAREIERGEDRR